MKSPHACKYLYGLIGYPLVHSFSLDYFNQKFISEDIDAQYINFEIEDLGLLGEIIAEYPNLNGLNVTAPYKEAVIPFLDTLDEDARQIGAVNVIRFIRDRSTGALTELRGYNSDVVGFGKTIPSILTPERISAMVLGTGGAAKAVRAAFEDYGVESVIYTDIGRDGMLSGVNIEATVRLAQALRIPVIASGGITDLRDIDALCAAEGEGVIGAITGRAIYEGTLDFAAAQARADALNGQAG